MEIVNIEAKTFQEMLDALFDLEKEFKLLRNRHPNCQLNEWLDNQEVCEILNISLRTLQYLKNRGNIHSLRLAAKRTIIDKKS